jgi:cytochrome c553
MKTMSAKPIMTALAMAALLAGCKSSGPEMAANQVDGTIHLCSSCHGITGRSVSPEFPILAAQQADYIAEQLHSFRDHSRADPHAHTYMWGMAARLSDATISGVAKYFSEQAPVAGRPADAVSLAIAAPIFTDGIEARDVPACAACHGDGALGQGSIPRLAGQHADYLAEQLGEFRTNVRSNETMHQNALNLTEPEIRALAIYLASL